MFDTIHEAADVLSNTGNLNSNYEAAMNYIKRDVCSEEGFFLGILGLSYSDDNDISYKMKYGFKTDEKFDPTITRGAYYGVSTDNWKNLSTSIKNNTIKSPGLFSSITESSPVTAFIQERVDKVFDYLDAINQQVESVKY
jgi:hypothetical protein